VPKGYSRTAFGRKEHEARGELEGTTTRWLLPRTRKASVLGGVVSKASVIVITKSEASEK
jgi:hypothetical protein